MKASYGKYSLFSCFWKGWFSEVCIGKNDITGELVVLKFLERNSNKKIQNLIHIETELRIADKVSHKNIVKFHEVIYTDNFIIIVMENLQEGTLLSFKQNAIYEPHISKYFRWGREILEGLSYLHKRGISHHDIKPENIAFDDLMQAKIIDFGLAEDTANYNKIRNCEQICGTPYFVPPEIIDGNPYNGEKSDIWSFGVTFHYMITGKLPYKVINPNKHFNSSDIKDNIDIKCTGTAKKIVEWAMQVSPEKRPTAEQLLNSNLFAEGEKIAIPIGSTKTKPVCRPSLNRAKVVPLKPRLRASSGLRNPITIAPLRK